MTVDVTDPQDIKAGKKAAAATRTAQRKEADQLVAASFGGTPRQLKQLLGLSDHEIIKEGDQHTCKAEFRLRVRELFEKQQKRSITTQTDSSRVDIRCSGCTSARFHSVYHKDIGSWETTIATNHCNGCKDKRKVCFLNQAMPMNIYTDLSCICLSQKKSASSCNLQVSFPTDCTIVMPIQCASMSVDLLPFQFVFGLQQLILDPLRENPGQPPLNIRLLSLPGRRWLTTY